MRRPRVFSVVAIGVCACAFGSAPVYSEENQQLPDCNRVAQQQITATFSIVAADPKTGICGAAVASRYPAVGRVVPNRVARARNQVVRAPEVAVM